jgi:2,3-bisphosphoglycerate-independent phosphoglycerate mutase
MGMSEKQAVQVQRGPAEAASLAEDISAFKAAYCGSFVTMDDHWLRDCAVKHLALEETRSLARCLEAEWPAGDLVFRAVAPGRVCVLLRDAVEVPDPGVPPCSLEGDRVDAFFSGGRQTGLPADVFETSGHILAHQTLNDVRLDLGENPANALWIWGGGLLHRTQDLITAGRAGGLMLTQSPMAAGMARMTGMDILPLKAPWQCKKAGPAFPLKKVVDAVRRHDRIFIYVEAPAKLYQYGSARDKVRALEAVDQHLLGPMLSVLEAHGPFRVVLCSNGFVSTPENRCMALETPLVVSGTNLGRNVPVVHWEQ